MRPVGLLERPRRWWAPGEYDDEGGESDGEGFALSDDQYRREKPTTSLVHEAEEQGDPGDELPKGP
jgi:hypothetical protein